MIDIHAHILPGFDDGAQNEAEAVEMARQAAADGIDAIVATPHILDPAGSHRERILAGVARLQEQLDLEQIPVRILPGAEIHIGPGVARAVEDGLAMTFCDGGRYLLLELPLNELPRYAETVVFDLLTLGVTPIIAHPERCRDLARAPRLLAGLVGRGCLAQVSTGSVRGRFGREPARAAQAMLGLDLVHFLATDGHGPGRRRVVMAEARDRVAEWCGPETASRLTDENPAKVLAGQPIDAAPGQGEKGCLLSRLGPAIASWWK